MEDYKCVCVWGGGGGGFQGSFMSGVMEIHTVYGLISAPMIKRLSVCHIQ
jgi:hypothetical protein